MRAPVHRVSLLPCVRSVSFLRRSLAPRIYEEGCPGAVPIRIATVASLLRNDGIIGTHAAKPSPGGKVARRKPGRMRNGELYRKALAETRRFCRRVVPSIGKADVQWPPLRAQKRYREDAGQEQLLPHQARIGRRPCRPLSVKNQRFLPALPEGEPSCARYRSCGGYCHFIVILR